MSDVDAKYQVPSRYRLTSKLIPLAKEKRVAAVNAQLEEAKHIALTVDIWTDRRMHSYIAVTVHTFVNWEAKSHLLHFAAFKGSHIGAKIAAELDNVISKHKIQEKVVHIVSDNASNMRKAFQLLCENAMDEDENSRTTYDIVDDDSLFDDLEEIDAQEVSQVIDRNCLSRLSCFAHSLQLDIKDAMDKCASARPVMAKCCKLANYCHQSAVFREQFEIKFGQGHSLPSTNVTRWSSTYWQLWGVQQLDEQLLTELVRQTGHNNLVSSRIMRELAHFEVK